MESVRFGLTATSLFYAAFEFGILVGGPLFGTLLAQTGSTTALLVFAALPIASVFLVSASRQNCSTLS
ncbi:MAG: hypothetical protein JO235_23550 [Chroococcidiopsidaceae cyanobacterium CP_BM_RX_35]|nr:hypothetical protein [Chroococcidiopsidaceae cyanobacterium CP_BM_RX_35]